MARAWGLRRTPFAPKYVTADGCSTAFQTRRSSILARSSSRPCGDGARRYVLYLHLMGSPPAHCCMARPFGHWIDKSCLLVVVAAGVAVPHVCAYQEVRKGSSPLAP